jgi:hypothetical protein
MAIRRSLTSLVSTLRPDAALSFATEVAESRLLGCREQSDILSPSTRPIDFHPPRAYERPLRVYRQCSWFDYHATGYVWIIHPIGER